MRIATIILIALGLAMDAFAVSITSGLAIKKSRTKHALRIAAYFGGFQAIMPVIGWLAGLGLKDFIADVDHWIAFGLLSFIGIKMIYEAFYIKEDKQKTDDSLNNQVVLILAIATSIDALAVGVSFAFLSISIVMPVVVIGLITFVLSFLGVYLGNRVGHFFESRIEIFGGIILIGIGIKILIEHLTH